jgi:hypothetical protein
VFQDAAKRWAKVCRNILSIPVGATQWNDVIIAAGIVFRDLHILFTARAHVPGVPGQRCSTLSRGGVAGRRVLQNDWMLFQVFKLMEYGDRANHGLASDGAAKLLAVPGPTLLRLP